MSNYKWVKHRERYVDLMTEDFSQASYVCVPVEEMNPLILNKISDNGIDYLIDEELGSYLLSAVERKTVEITAPLYESSPILDSNELEYTLVEEDFTEDTIDPAQRDWVKETYLRSIEEVASEQAKIFEELFIEKSLDGGLSSVVTISSDPDEEPNYFYQQYIPKNYIKVCEKNCPFSRGYKHDMVFIKKMDAQGQVVPIKLHDLYIGLAIGKGGKNIKKIAKMINARRIDVEKLM